jgi:hypothetical protein
MVARPRNHFYRTTEQITITAPVAAVVHVVAAKRQIYHRPDLADQLDLRAATLSSRVHNDPIN